MPKVKEDAMGKMEQTMKAVLMSIMGFLILGCGNLEEGSGTSISIKDFPGTVKIKFPIKWDIGKVGGTWRDTFSTELRSYNPFASLEGTAYGVLNVILDPLFDYDPDTREWKGFQLKSYEVKENSDGHPMELVCELRDDIYWSDGVQMTADDVVFYENELDWDKDIYFRGYTGHMIKMDDGTEKPIQIEKIDKLRFKYIFPRIVSTPMLMVNGFVLPKHIWEPVKNKGKDAVMAFWNINTPPSQIIGNGPYLLEEYKPVERMVYKRNPKYWKKDEAGNALPYRDKIVAAWVPPGNETVNLLKFQTGEIEAYTMRGKDMATLLPDSPKKGFDIWNGGPSDGYGALIFNQEPGKVKDFLHTLFIDKRFHYAISSLIDRQTIINQVENGFGEPYYHFVTDINKYYNPKYATPYHYDPEKAKQLLAELGLKDTNGDSYLEDKSGNTIEFKIMLYSTDPTIIDMHNVMIDDFKQAGLKVTMDPLDYNVWAEKLQFTHDWQCTMLGFTSPTFTEQWTNVWPSYGDRHYWYPNQKKPATEWEARIDELHKRLVNTYDPAEAKKLYDEFQQIIMDQLPFIPTYRRYGFTAVYKKWGNVNVNARHEMGDNGGVRLYLKDNPVQ
jgi:peptide/nickel transport system substrate-binding protein